MENESLFVYGRILSMTESAQTDYAEPFIVLAFASTSVLIGSAFYGAGAPAWLSIIGGVATTFAAIYAISLARWQIGSEASE